MSKKTSAKWKEQHAHDRRSTDLPINSRVAIAIVDDPYSSVGEKIAVVRSVRDDPLADMLSRGLIDRALFETGREWQRQYEAIEIGPIGAMDPTKEPVDGRGPTRDPLTDRQQRAIRKIQEADRILGRIGSILIRQLLAERLSVASMCKIHNCDTARKATFLSHRVRECLEQVGLLWGFIGHAQRRA